MTTDTPAPTPVTADSMVGQHGPYEFWFTLSRTAFDSAGRMCLERGLEIRSDSSQRLVPLLYTREAPMPESDSTVLIHLFDSCAPGDLYRVNLRTAQPVRVR
ncbi:MAG TPA: hypothetical protein VFO96_13800 [Gemmatimonadales bacterium]|nr:hypothetical protein [Gemmatimonadales bacterium]